MKTIGIYQCMGQPPHKGQYLAYKKLRQIAGNDTFVVITDHDPTLEAALHFGDKEQILVRHGIPSSHIRQVKDLSNPVEVLNNFDPESTVVIYALSHKNATEKINSSSYYKSIDFTDGKLKPFKYHSYILIIDDSKIGDKVFSSKNIRESLGSHRFTREQKEKFFKHFFGWFDLGLFELLKSKYENAHQSDVFEPPPEDVKEVLTREIVNILNELMGLSSTTSTSSTIGGSPTTQPKTSTQIRSDNIKKVQDLNAQKRNLEKKTKEDRAELDYKKSGVDRLRKDTLKADRDALNQLNKKISSPSSEDSSTISTDMSSV